MMEKLGNFLAKESKTFDKFRQFKALVEKQSGHQIKVLRSNKGGGYDSNDFHDFCKLHGIKRQFSTRYTPQQNGVAKNKNKIITNMFRGMLTTKHLKDF